MKRFNLGALFDSRKFLIVFSLLIAIVSWVAVAMTTSQTIEIPLPEVPVDLTLVEDSLADLNLSILEGTGQTVTVWVRGPRTVVGQLQPEDVTVTARLTGVTEAGTRDLQLAAADDDDYDFEVLRFTPSTVRVRLDELDSRAFEITPVVNGLSTPPDYMWEPYRVSPGSVTISGPATELDKVGSVVVEAELEEALTRNYAASLPIKLYDLEGSEIDPEESMLSLEREEAQLNITVLRIKELPLEVGFTNVPMGFPLDDLKELMEMSVDSVQVAGPTSVMDNYSQLRVGYIDVRSLTVENNVFQFEVTLPSDNFENMSNVNTVTVEFDTFYWDEAVLNLSEIEIVNEPLDYEVTLLTTAINGVLFVGDQDVIADLTADDVVVEVNLADKELTVGQSRLPDVKISVPTKGLVWAVGEQSVIILVEERGD